MTSELRTIYELAQLVSAWWCDLVAVDFCIDICATSDSLFTADCMRDAVGCYAAKMRSAAVPGRQCTASELESAGTATDAVAMMRWPSIP